MDAENKETLTLWCTVLGKPLLTSFKVSSSSTVDELKGTINKGLEITAVAASLTLWNVSDRLQFIVVAAYSRILLMQVNGLIDCTTYNETTLSEYIEFLGDLNDFAERLSPVSRLSKIWPQKPLDGHLHLVVVPPIGESDKISCSYLKGLRPHCQKAQGRSMTKVQNFH